jgi:hypothetical protein
MFVAVLDQVEMFDQQIAVARAIAQESGNLGQCGRIDLTAFGRGPGLAFAGAGMSELLGFARNGRHQPHLINRKRICGRAVARQRP